MEVSIYAARRDYADDKACPPFLTWSHLALKDLHAVEEGLIVATF